EDDHGNLWLGAQNGLFKFNPTSGKLNRYTIRDGICSSGLWVGYTSSKTGEMFWGGNNGLTIFHPDSIRDNPYLPPIVITSFKKYGREMELDTTLSLLSEINLKHDDKVISFEYAALNYINPDQNQYAYMLEGFDRDWVYVGNKRDVTYTNLDPGRYVFRVKGSNNDGVWNETGASIALIIPPPPWKSWWAYTLYVLAIAAAIYAAWRATLRRARTLDEMKLRRMEAEKLQEMDQLKSRFFANISHEFRTPLTLILGPIDKLLSRIEDNESRQELSLMKKHARRVLDLVTQLLDLSRLEADRMKLQASRQNVITLLKGLVQSFASLADRQAITLTFSAESEDVQAYVDKDAMVKIMNNLLSNAFKFTESGGEISVNVATNRESDLSADGEVVVAISDTGCGIPVDRQDKIFDRFYQVDSSTTREGEGTGIGLALTRELVELHKGSIEVNSREAEGTTFTVRLPLGSAHLSALEIVEASELLEEVVPSDMTLADEEESKPPTTRKSLPLVLIVEDNADVRSYIRSYLDEEYRCYEATDGEHGLSQAIKHMPDLILSDIMMPQMDGVELCRRIKTDERTSHIPVILLTAKADMDSKLEGLETGADDYLAKPFEAAELQARIRNLIEQRRRLRKQFDRKTTLRPKDITVTSLDERFLQRALDAVEMHISDAKFDVKEFSKAVGMSRTNLHYKLRALTGQSTSEFIRTQRMIRAAQLLRQNFGNVTEVAFEVGFSNPSYFTECFKKHFGQPPSRYDAALPPR
ncbi:MAG: response regulator, partial [Fidelibacterota bacterium]